MTAIGDTGLNRKIYKRHNNRFVMSGEVRDECGIAAVSLKKPKDEHKSLFYIYRCLLNLQHRGQLAAGFTTYNKKRTRLIHTYKELGTVNEVFRTNNKQKSLDIFRKYSGNKAIGHVRYATSGRDSASYAQPFERVHGRLWKWFSFCFNGNLANYAKLKKQLLDKPDYNMVYDTDTEVIMHYLARELIGSRKPNLTKVFNTLAKKFDGAYNIAFINGFGDLVVIRDPLGIRPLCYAIKDGDLLVASESNALVNCGFTKYRSLKPGYMILAQNGNISIKKYAESKRKAYCMFEWVYFANVSSVLNGKSVYGVRNRLGKELAKLETEKIDKDYVVVSVPDTAKASGDALAYELGVPHVEGLIRNRYVGRTFIEGAGREDRVRNKYTALYQVVAGKKVILVDDSIVRGATVKQLVRYLKKVGKAKEVHIRVTCPPIKAPCFYGIDMSTIGELLVPGYEQKIDPNKISQDTCRKIAKDIGADSLIYQTQKGLVKALNLPKQDLCMACLNGKYPTPAGCKMYDNAVKSFRSGKKARKRTCE